MKKTKITICALIASVFSAQAAEPEKGILVTFSGSEVCYKLEDMPTVKYADVEGTKHAMLYVSNAKEPVATFALAKDKQLVITYGEYAASGIGDVKADKVVITERNGHKLIQGGQLIIVSKDGKKYNAVGTEIK